MKKFTLSAFLNLSLCLALITTLLMSSCSSPQHFSFSAAPAAYQKHKAETVAVAPAAPVVTEAATVAEAPAAPAETFTASTETAPVVLPELAKASKAAVASQAPTAKQKLTLTQKVVLNKLQKQATKLEQKTKKSQEAAAGPVSNKSAIALILIGLVIALFGALLGGIFYTLGTLVILIGLILLILN
jgi:hypothetical protein